MINAKCTREGENAGQYTLVQPKLTYINKYKSIWYERESKKFQVKLSYHVYNEAINSPFFFSYG